MDAGECYAKEKILGMKTHDLRYLQLMEPAMPSLQRIQYQQGLVVQPMMRSALASENAAEDALDQIMDLVSFDEEGGKRLWLCGRYGWWL